MTFSWSGHSFTPDANRTIMIDGPSRQSLPIPPLTEILVRDELLAPSPAPAYDAVTAFNRRASHHTWGIPASLQPETLQIRKADREPLQRGTDYELASPDFGGLKFLRPEKFAGPVYLSYQLKYQRVDVIAVNADGQIKLFCGRESLALPRWPLLPPGWDGICRVHSFFSNAMSADHLYPIADRRHSRLINYELLHDMAARMPADSFTAPPRHPDADHLYTRHLDYSRSAAYSREQALALQQRIRAQGKFTLVYFGDSVTQGGDVDKEYRFPFLLNQWLRQQYPEVEFTCINSAIGGTSSSFGRERFTRDVLDHQPDAVTVMFVLNDFRTDDQTILGNHRFFVEELRKRHAIPLFITPNYNTGVWMEGLDHGVDRIRKFCEEEKIICVDVYRLWQDLRDYGIPYETMLANGINHPDNMAAAMFSESLKLLLS